MSHECPVPRIAIEQRFSLCLRLQSKTNFCTKDTIDQKHDPLALENAPTFSERYGPMLTSTTRNFFVLLHPRTCNGEVVQARREKDKQTQKKAPLALQLVASRSFVDLAFR